MPTPPLRVDRMNKKIRGSLLKRSMSRCRSSTFVVPSRRKYVKPWMFRKRSRMFSTRLIWVKMSAREPRARSACSRSARRCSLPQSNCTSRRSGKYSVWRIYGRRRTSSVTRPATYRRSAPAAWAGAVRRQLGRWAHTVRGGGARTRGMTKTNCSKIPPSSAYRAAGSLTRERATPPRSPPAGAGRWAWRQGSRTRTARRRSAPGRCGRHAQRRWLR
mmetsp:Transcript_35950/g.101160  ORF Transcript_35950/g.101160 Transcript_35950/m.101160 type:complete len:217 (-) Transcript_35950:1472-2122(-)